MYAFLLFGLFFTGIESEFDQLTSSSFESGESIFVPMPRVRPPLNSGSTEIFWSQLRLPDGNPPGPGDVVTVTSDERLVLDESAAVEGLLVLGEFFVDDQGPQSSQLQLRSDWVAVAAGGRFHVGWSEFPFTGKFELTLAGDDPQQDLNLGDFDGPNMTISNQDSFLMAMGTGSKIEIFADDALKRSWAQLGTTASAGAQTIRMAERTDWQVGDMIALASTDYDFNQAETATIAGVSADGLEFTLDTALSFTHYGEIETYSNGERDWDLDMRGEVALLSRDVRFTGDASAASTRYGGHSMIMNNASMRISGAEFTLMGQEGLLGKYPLHWHLMGDVSGQFVRNSSIHHTFNKGLTIHGTNNSQVSNNAIFETIGHSYFFEDGDETGNVLTGNLGFNTRASDSLEVATIGSDFDSPSTYWIENVDNVFVDNHAGGSERNGFWIEAQREGAGLTEFVGNTSHSNRQRAFFLQHGQFISDGSPTGDANNPQKSKPWEVVDFTVYKSFNRGLYVRGVEGVFRELKMAEMGEGTRFRLNQSIVDSLIVGRTANVGLPVTDEEIAQGRSLPGGEAIEGHMIYDGPGGLANVHFAGFYADEDTAISLTNAVHKSSAHYVTGLTFDADTPYGKRVRKTRGGRNTVQTDSAARAIIDIDGSLGGVLGGTVTQTINQSSGAQRFNANDASYFEPLWNSMVNGPGSFATIRVDNKVSDAANDGNNIGDFQANNKIFRRSDGHVAEGFGKQVGLFTDSSYTYELDFTGGPDQFRLWLADTPWGSSVIIRLDAVPSSSSVTLAHPYTQEKAAAREVSSFAMLEQSPDTAVFRDDGSLWVKLVAQMAHGYMWPQPHHTVDDELLGGVVVLIDSEANVNLNQLIFDDPSGGDTLASAPYAVPESSADLRLFLVHAQSGQRIRRLSNGRSISGSELRAGRYALDVRSSAETDSVRIAVSGSHVVADSQAPFRFNFDRHALLKPTLPGDQDVVISVQAFSEDQLFPVGSQVFRIGIDE
ncbi:MAG: G8 domain-containing protein, partial [Lysobacterales bacterium]